MFDKYLIVKPQHYIENKSEFAYKTLMDLQNNYAMHGDSIEEGILNILTNDDGHKDSSWYLEHDNFYLLRTDAHLSHLYNDESQNYNFISASKERWKEFFKKLLLENRVHDITHSFTDYDYERLSFIINKEDKTQAEIEEASDIFNHIMDEHEHTFLSSSIDVKYNDNKGDFSFELNPYFLISTRPFYCDVSKHLDESTIKKYIPIVLQEVLSYFHIIEHQIVLQVIDISDNIKIKHPLSHIISNTKILIDNQLKSNENLSDSDLSIIKNYLKSQLSIFENEMMYPWEAEEFIKKYKN